MTRFGSQSVAVLFAAAPSCDDVAASLGRFELTPRPAAGGDMAWRLGGPGFILPFLPASNGRVIVDVCDHSWPDSMGHPQDDPHTFTAWTMGSFGPHAYPCNLARAAEQAWQWSDAAGAVSRHHAFVRIRTTYVLGADDSAPVRPVDWDPVAELRFVTEVGADLVKMPGAVAWFVPGGEVLRSPEQIASDVERVRGDGPPPIGLWSNVRRFRLVAAPPEPDWVLMDTVGMQQFGSIDHEACFPRADTAPEREVARFLRSLSLHLLQPGPIVNDGDTADGPDGATWRARRVTEARIAPPRAALRWARADVQLPSALEP